MSRRYIELVSEYRNRNQWPCPSEFIAPIDCVNKSDSPLDAKDLLVLSYPEYAWYQVPYAAPLWEETSPGITPPRPRKINGMYYTSLWPLVSSLEQSISTSASKDSGWLGAMKFSGGTFEKPMLNGVVVTPPNQWSALVGNVSYNPYYTPKNDYFAGAMLICFTEDPSCYLNSWNDSQIVNIAVAFVPPANIGDVIEQPGSGAVGTIVCIISPTSFVVTLESTTTNPFDPAGGNIDVPLSGASSAAGVFSTSPTLAYSYDGQVETSIISGYNATTGTISLKSPLSKDFDSTTNYYLIDFNTDPNNDWVNFVSGGTRIFVPGGSSSPQAYEGLYFQNYTLSSEETNKDFGSKVIKYDFIRRIAYLDKPLPLKQKTLPTNFSFYGSDTFTIRVKQPIATKTYSRISVNNGSILDLRVLKPGQGYKVGETIGTSFTGYYNSPGIAFSYPSPMYNLNNNQGVAFRATIANVDINGGILKIKVVQQGTGFYRGTPFNITANSGSGVNAVLLADQVYQSLEIYRNSNLDSTIPLKEGNFVFLPNFGKIGTGGLLNNSKNVAPTIPRYFFPDTTNTSILDIRQSGYPPTVISCDISKKDNIPEDGLYQVISSFTKDITFGDWYAAIFTAFSPLTVLYLASPINLSNAGLTTAGTPAFLNNSSIFPSNSGYMELQQLEFLQYSGDNLHPLNFTGTRVSQNQMCCFEVKLISITIPNLPLDNSIGGLIAFYPFLYVELSNVNAPSRGNRGIIYSNNPNANKATFRLNVDDTNTPLRSKFIKLDGDGTVQTIKFKPNDDLYFRVYLGNGTLFETVIKDNSPPLPPNFFVQISAQFQIRKLGPEITPKPSSRSLHLRKVF